MCELYLSVLFHFLFVPVITEEGQSSVSPVFREKMESAIKTVVSVYLKSAKGKENLSGKDFQSLVKNQLGNILIDAENSKAVKDMQQGLDENRDGKVGFQEYMTLIGYLANNLSQQHLADEKEGKVKNNDGAVTQAEAPATAEADPSADKAAEPSAEAAPAEEAPSGEAEPEKAPVAEEGEGAAADQAAEEAKTEEEEDA